MPVGNFCPMLKRNFTVFKIPKFEFAVTVYTMAYGGKAPRCDPLTCLIFSLKVMNGKSFAT